MMKIFAVVSKNGGIVSNIVVGEDIDQVSEVVGECVEQNEQTGNSEIGSLWNGNSFVKKPYPSWIINENLEWQAPIPMPIENGTWQWNEELGDWEEVNAPA
jgi:hypothetical protein